ncbi:hypothetical protein SDC9_21203 [bioreactor metagenome]|uniref:Uncharacterized protein n=1 Tax=bioreactor metagenome TaxID=1076179 RepID=A0A644U8W0_9ZZZZ
MIFNEIIIFTNFYKIFLKQIFLNNKYLGTPKHLYAIKNNIIIVGVILQKITSYHSMFLSIWLKKLPPLFYIIFGIYINFI